MKYTAKPVTQNARNKKAAASAPAKLFGGKRGKTENDKPASAPAVPAAAAAPTAASANSSQQSDSSSNEQSRITKTREAGEDGMMYDVTRETGNSSGDANTLQNVSAPANDLGKAKGGRQASTTAEKSSYNDWVVDQISSGKQSAQHMADQKYISKDRVGEYAKYAPKPKASTSSKDSKSSSKETWNPVMTKAVEATEGVQTHRYEQARQRNSYMRKNFWSTQGAKKTMKKMQKEGYMNADGSFTDSGKANLSDKQRDALNITRDTSLGINEQQLAFKNQTGVWAAGGNTKVGNKFERTAGKASEHMRAPNTGTSTTKKKGVSRSVMTDPGVQTPTVENNPNSVKETKVDAKGLDPRATHTYGANTPQVKRSGPDFTGELDRRLMEENVFNDQLSKIEQPSHTGMMGDAAGKYKMSRLHSSKSPAKMWNTDVSPAKEGEALKHAPKNAKKVAAKEKADKNARWAAASPAKMWGPSKVKAGKNGFNR